ncbi:MAG: IucC family-domain-containing protein [Linnemannia gamsii]|nr:MAG: IucC family-domain-containing protein [Linnemannia gamsii]
MTGSGLKSLDTTQLPATSRGMFASSSRLVVCLVNEGLMQATYLPDVSVAPMDGLGSVALLTLQDLSIVVSLAHTPQIDEQGAILFLDRLDLQYPILVGTMLTASELPARLTECNCPSALMRLVAARMDNIDEMLLKQLCAELDSSVEHMSNLFLHPHPEPTLNSTAIEWEQSIIEGQGTHPMHKSRYAVAPVCRVKPNTNTSKLTLTLVSMPADAVVVSGEFLTIMAKLLPADMVPIGRVPILVHPFQVPNVVSMFPEATIHPFTVTALAQSSLRTVIIPELPNYAFKLPVGIRVSSAMRTISPWTTFMGPRMIPILDRIIPKSKVLKYAAEHSSVSARNSNFDTARHLACVIRDDFSATLREQNEAVIVSAALTECPNGDVARVIKICNLNSQASRVEFLSIFVDLALKAFLVPLIEHGFSFEAHQQNTLVRLTIPQPGDNSPVYPSGFIVRDFGGVRVHQETLFKSTGMRVPVLPGNPNEVTDLKDAYTRLYHSLIQMHLHRLIRALDLHYSGQGWLIVRTKLEHYFKPGDIGHELWLSSETCKWKCFIRMKMKELYKDYLYRDVPNILLYKGEGRELIH